MSGYLSYRVAAFLSRRLPGRSAYWVGLRIADLFCACQREEREAVIRNLRQVFSFCCIEPAGDTLRGMSRKTYQYFGKYLVDFFRFSSMSLDELRRVVSLQHASRLKDVHTLGRGVIIVSAHMGNWELGAAVVRGLGYPLNAVVLPERMDRLDRLLSAQREKRGMHVIPLGNSAFGVLRCLKKGELVALLADRDFSQRTETVEFFGKPARIPLGPALLSLRAGAPIVPVAVLRQEDDTFLMRFHEPILPEVEKDVAPIQRKICAFLEREIGERPHQWFIFEDFWKNDTAANA